jgi:hypothetical protein
MKRMVFVTMSIVATAGLLGTQGRLHADDKAKPAPGIYVTMTGKSGGDELTRIPGAHPEQVKTQGLGKMILTQGLMKASMMVALAGPVADLRLTNTSPVFVVSLPESAPPPTPGAPPPDPATMLSQMSQMNQMMSGDTMPAGAKTGADFQLVQLTIASGNRQADMGKVGSQGGKLKNSIDCDQERVASGYYRLHPKQPLKAGGEYAFFFQNSASAGAGGSAWAFGVDAK